MATGDPAEVDGLVREVMAVLRRAYDLGRADALREAAAMLAAEAPPAAAPAQGADATHPPPGSPAPVERRRKRGRPGVMTKERSRAAAALLAEGRLSQRSVAQEVGVSPTRLHRWLKANGNAD